MDKRLDILREFYEDEAPDLERLRREEPEIDSLLEVKAMLEARPRHRPSAFAVNAVLEAAAAPKEGPRRDRAPVARRSATYLRVGAVSAVVVVLLTMVTVLNIHPVDQPVSKSEPVARDESEVLHAEELAAAPEMDVAVERTTSAPRAVQHVSRSDDARTGWSISSAERLAIAGAATRLERPSLESLYEAPAFATSFTPAAESGDILAWDQSSDVIEVSQHIEMIGGGVDRGWEPPSVPLEMLPQQRRTTRAIVPVGERP